MNANVVGSIASSSLPRRAAASTSSSSPASSSSPRGAFIVLEGVDRCGKTTQCARLVERLRESGVRELISFCSTTTSKGAGGASFLWFPFAGLSNKLFPLPRSKNTQKHPQVKAEMWRFPDRATEIGTMINAYLARSKELDDAAVHLLFSANRWEKRAELLRQLSDGVTLVCDRYAFSGVAFTAAKQKTGMGLDWCRAPDQGLPAPDAVLYLDLDPAEAERRGGFGAERYESAEMLKSVRATFAEIAAFVDGRCTRWLRVDASGGVEEVGERVAAAAAAAVDSAAEGQAPLRSLWEGSAGVIGWPPPAAEGGGALSDAPSEGKKE